MEQTIFFSLHPREETTGEGGREGGKEGGREGGREGGSEGGKEGRMRKIGRGAKNGERGRWTGKDEASLLHSCTALYVHVHVRMNMCYKYD